MKIWYILYAFIYLNIIIYINGRRDDNSGLTYCDPGMYCETEQNPVNSRCFVCPTGKAKSFESVVACHSWGLDKSICDPVIYKNFFLLDIFLILIIYLYNSVLLGHFNLRQIQLHAPYAKQENVILKLFHLQVVRV